MRKGFILNKTFDNTIFRTIIRRYWWWTALLVMLMFTLAFFYLRYTKPLYQSSLVLQLSTEDNAKAVLDVRGFKDNNNEYFKQIELMKSQLLFEEALKALNLNVSIYTRGEFLIEENYHPELFSVNILAIKDSTIVNNEINIFYDNQKIELSYVFNGKKRTTRAKIGHLLKSPEFDIIINTTDLTRFQNQLSGKNVYFIINSSSLLTNRLLTNLKVEPLDVQAQTVRISYIGHNPYLCKDVVASVGNAFIGFNDFNNKKALKIF